MVWQGEAVSRSERTAGLGYAGATVWLTGLPASGKTTLAGALERRLVVLGRSAYRLDGDNLRHGLTGDLGFDPRRPGGERAPDVPRGAAAGRRRGGRGRRAGEPLSRSSRRGRERFTTEAELTFLEVHVDTPLGPLRAARPEGPVRTRARGESSMG